MKIAAKPASGSAEGKALLNEFVHLCRRLYWHAAFRALGEETLLVTDPELKAAFEDNWGRFQCNTAAPDTVKEIPSGVTRALFLCRKNEWIKVKAAKARWPGISVQSLTYDIAPMGALEGREFPVATGTSLEKDAVAEAALPVPRNILVSTPGSDSEYLRVVLEKNGVASVTPFAGAMLVPWVLLSDNFKLVRFANKALEYALLRGGAVYLDLKLLLVLLRQTHLKRDRFFNWVNDGGGHMLYFITRDKARQVAINQLLAEADYASLWDRAATRVKELPNQRIDIADTLDRIPGQLGLESRLEKPLQNIEEFKVISLEDLVVAPHGVLQAISQFWALNLPRRRQTIDWQKRYLLLPDFIARLADLRVALAKAYGLEDVGFQ